GLIGKSLLTSSECFLRITSMIFPDRIHYDQQSPAKTVDKRMSYISLFFCVIAGESQLSGVVDPQPGTPQRNGFANRASFGSQARVPTTPRASRLARTGRRCGFQLSTPAPVPSRGEPRPSLERPDRLPKQRDIHRD